MKLTAREMALLEMLLLHHPRLLPRQYLEEHLSTWQRDINSNIIQVHMSNLRRNMAIMPAGIIFIVCFMDCFLHQASFVTGNWCYDRHRSVRLVICFDFAIYQIAQSGLSSLKVIYYSAQLFSNNR
ncbi:hypothetical protein YL67_004532 [Salmonella enterica subsp. enterica]|nr:hypothetical protein [Salmonella enterica subsp. enterica serovar Javiana]